MKRPYWKTIVTGIAVLAVQSALPQNTISNGLIAFWKFDEGTGSVAEDSSGNGKTGTIQPANAPDPKWGTGDFKGSISFSGKDDHHLRVPIAKNDVFNTLKKRISVVARIYPRSFPVVTDNPYVLYISAVQRQWATGLHPDLFYLGFGPHGPNNQLHYKWHLGLKVEGNPSDHGEIDLYRLVGGAPITPGKWIHMVGTYDGDTGVMRLYVNGDMIGEHTRPGEMRLDDASLERPLVIGCELNEANQDRTAGLFDGYVDEVRVYNRALTADEVKQLATAAGH